MNGFKKTLNLNSKVNKETQVRKDGKSNTRNHNENLKKPLSNFIF